jgi:hypothetical protein
VTENRRRIVKRDATGYAPGQVNVSEKVAALEALLVRVKTNAAEPRRPLARHDLSLIGAQLPPPLDASAEDPTLVARDPLAAEGLRAEAPPLRPPVPEAPTIDSEAATIPRERIDALLAAGGTPPPGAAPQKPATPGAPSFTALDDALLATMGLSPAAPPTKLPAPAEPAPTPAAEIAPPERFTTPAPFPAPVVTTLDEPAPGSDIPRESGWDIPRAAAAPGEAAPAAASTAEAASEALEGGALDAADAVDADERAAPLVDVLPPIRPAGPPRPPPSRPTALPREAPRPPVAPRVKRSTLLGISVAPPIPHEAPPPAPPPPADLAYGPEHEPTEPMHERAAAVRAESRADAPATAPEPPVLLKPPAFSESPVIPDKPLTTEPPVMLRPPAPEPPPARAADEPAAEPPREEPPSPTDRPIVRAFGSTKPPTQETPPAPRVVIASSSQLPAPPPEPARAFTEGPPTTSRRPPLAVALPPPVVPAEPEPVAPPRRSIVVWLVLAAVLVGVAVFVVLRLDLGGAGEAEPLGSVTARPRPAPTSSAAAPTSGSAASPPTSALAASATASAAPSVAPSAAPTTAPTASAAATPTVSAAPSADPAAAPLPPNRGYLTVTSGAEGVVFVNGQRAGTPNQRLVTTCGPRFVRIAAPDDPKAAPTWLTPGRSVIVPCGGEATIALEP